MAGCKLLVQWREDNDKSMRTLGLAFHDCGHELYRVCDLFKRIIPLCEFEPPKEWDDWMKRDPRDVLPRLEQLEVQLKEITVQVNNLKRK